MSPNVGGTLGENTMFESVKAFFAGLRAKLQVAQDKLENEKVVFHQPEGMEITKGEPAPPMVTPVVEPTPVVVEPAPVVEPVVTPVQVQVPKTHKPRNKPAQQAKPKATPAKQPARKPAAKTAPAKSTTKVKK